MTKITRRITICTIWGFLSLCGYQIGEAHEVMTVVTVHTDK